MMRLLAAVSLLSPVAMAEIYNGSWENLVLSWGDDSKPVVEFRLSGDALVGDTGKRESIMVEASQGLSLDMGSHTLRGGDGGSGLYSNQRLFSLSPEGKLNLFNGVVSDCVSVGREIGDYDGAVIKGSEGSQMNLSKVVFTENRVNAGSIHGGVIYSGGAIFMESCEFLANKAVRGNGGAIYVEESSTVSMMGRNVFRNNIAINGGAIYANDSVSGFLNGVGEGLFCYNLAENKGGALYTGMFLEMKGRSSGAFLFERNRVDSTDEGFGGAVFTSNSAVLTGVDFKSNSVGGVFSAKGGALFSQGGESLVLTNCHFINNYAMSENISKAVGGAIYVEDTHLSIIADGENSVFQGNRDGVTQDDPEMHVPLDGRSSAIYFSQTGLSYSLSLDAKNGGSVVFHDSLYSDSPGASLLINEKGGNGLVAFKDNVVLDGFSVSLAKGIMSLGNNTWIKGDLSTATGTMLVLDGMMFLTGDYLISDKGDSSCHTIQVNMNDALYVASRESSLVTMDESARIIRGSEGGIDRGIVDVKIKVGGVTERKSLFTINFFSEKNAEELVPLLHEVTVIDADGWYENIDSGDYFTFLTGQSSLLLPGTDLNPEKPEGWTAPKGVGGDQAGTMWTTAHGLWSFGRTAALQRGRVLNPGSSTSFWVSGLGEYFTQKEQDLSHGYNYRSGGYALGGATQIGSQWAAGAALGETYGYHDISSSLGSLNQRSLMAILSVTYSQELTSVDSLSITLQGGYGESSNDGSVYNPVLEDVLDGSWDDQAWMIDITGRWSHILDEKTAAELYAGVQYMGVSQSDSELTGYEYKFRLRDGEMNDLRAALGVGISRNETIFGHAMTAYGRLGVIQDLSRQIPRVVVQGVSRQWMAQGAEPGQTALTVSLGSQVKLTERWSTAIDYSLESAEGSVNQSGSVSFIVQF